MGVNFFWKNAKLGGGGAEGGLAKDHTFSGFCFVHPSLSWTTRSSPTGSWATTNFETTMGDTDKLTQIRSKILWLLQPWKEKIKLYFCSTRIALSRVQWTGRKADARWEQSTASIFQLVCRTQLFSSQSKSLIVTTGQSRSGRELVTWSDKDKDAQKIGIRAGKRPKKFHFHPLLTRCQWFGFAPCLYDCNTVIVIVILWPRASPPKELLCNTCGHKFLGTKTLCGHKIHRSWEKHHW